MSSSPKKEKQKKNLLKIVDKLYKKDLEEILLKFFKSKSGAKYVIKQRVIDLINDNKDIDFNKIRKEIKKVYKSNPKIKKSPKKVKKNLKKSNNSSETTQECEQLEEFLNSFSASPDPRSDLNEDPFDHNSTDSPSSTTSPLLNPYDNVSSQTANPIDYRIDPSPPNLFLQYNSGQVYQPYAQPPQSTPNINTNMGFVSQPQVLPQNQMNANNEIMNRFLNYRNPIPNTNQRTLNDYGFQSASVQQSSQQNMCSDPVPNPQLMQPINTNHFNGSTQTINLNINHNYFPNNPQNYFRQNVFPQNLGSDVLNPQTYDSLIEQQKFLLSQYPKSFQESEQNTSESDTPLTEFVFKCLPKFKVFKTLTETKTIGSLTDMGTELQFNINPTDFSSNYEIHSNEDLKTLLNRNSMKIQLRFSYVADINSEQQKDKLPEHLSIECNNQRIFNYEEDFEMKFSPFDLSDFCQYFQNSIRFCVTKPNYTFLMPCIYEISIVYFETCDTFLSKLKQNMFQFLSSDSTKQLIRSRTQQNHDEIISINTDTKLKLICPLSCQRIETPCRTSECKHIECFDAFAFFKTNEMRYDWLCPICQKSAQFDKLRIDGYITEILNSTNEFITEIIIKSDGSYDTIKKEMISEEEPITIYSDDSDSKESDEITFSIIDSDGCIVID